MIPSLSSTYESLLDDVELHTSLSRDIIRSVFDRLILETDFREAFDVNRNEPSYAEYKEEIENVSTVLSSALFYDVFLDGGHAHRMSITSKKSIEALVDAWRRIQF